MNRRSGIWIVAAVLCASSGLIRPSSGAPHRTSGDRVQSRTHAVRLLAFESNAGQADARAAFVARTPTSSFFFTQDQVVMASGRDVVQLRFPGSKDAHLLAIDPLPGVSNYLIGSDASRWKTGIKTYAKVKYESIYRGIDLVFYGNEQQLEYDLIVSPGADPSVVRMAMDGVGELAVEPNGDLTGRATQGQIRLRKPVIYQATEADKTMPVDGHYVINGAEVTFAVDDYDQSRPLVIDPVVVYSTYLGGSESDRTTGSSGGGARQMIAVDATGAAYIAGRTESPVFPTTPGSWQSSAPSWIGLGFVTKIAPDGESLVYSTFIGGTTATEDCGQPHYCGGVPAGIAIDAAGNAYVVGETWGRDFPASPTFAGPDQTNNFLLKLNPSGSSLVYSVFFTSGFNNSPSGVAVDNTGNVYVAGSTAFGISIVPTDALQSQCNCGGLLGRNGDAYVVKFNSTATQIMYATYLGGTGRDEAAAIAVNAAGEAYVSGRTGSEDFPTANAAQPTFGQGGFDDFVVKLNANGSALVFSTYLGGSGRESGNALGAAIAVDAAGRAYVTGYTDGGIPTTPGSFLPVAPQGGTPRAYVVKYTGSGQIAYATYLTGSGGSFGTSVAVDAQGRAYVAGSAASGFPVTADATQPIFANGGADAYVTVLNPSGSALEFSTYLGGEFDNDFATGIALGPNGSIYVAGTMEGNGFGSFPTTPNAFQPSFAGGPSEVFVTRIGLQPPDTTPPTITSVSVSPNTLWPPNHTMRQVTVNVAATDNVSAEVTCGITNVSSNEPTSGIDNGDKAPDWQDTVGLSTWLRAERDARRAGRIYTLTITCSDEAGNTSTRSVGVTVPVNQGK